MIQGTVAFLYGSLEAADPSALSIRMLWLPWLPNVLKAYAECFERATCYPVVDDSRRRCIRRPDFNICVTGDGVSRRGCRALVIHQGFTKNYHPSRSSFTRYREMITCIRAASIDDTKAIYKPKFAYNR